MKTELIWKRTSWHPWIKSNEIRDWVSLWSHWSHKSFNPAPTTVSTEQYGHGISKTIVRWAILRELQVRKDVDVVRLRDLLGITVDLPSADGVLDLSELLVTPSRFSRFSAVFSGAIAEYKKSGAIRGNDAGVDPANGYKYQRWVLVDPSKAASYAKKQGLRLMPPAGKSAMYRRYMSDVVLAIGGGNG